MQTRLDGLRRIALVYLAIKHAQALALEQASAAVLEAESLIRQRKTQVLQSTLGAQAALDAGESVTWQLHEAQRQFMEWNAAGLARLCQQREVAMLEAAEVYRTGRMQLEQMERVLSELHAKANLSREHRVQRESDDRFLTQQWWKAHRAAVMATGAADVAETEHRG